MKYVATLMLALMAGASARADVVKLPVYGGAGGEHFEYRCADNGYLVGLNGYTGLWIDNVQAVCAKYDPATGRMTGRAAEGPVFGGAQGKTNATNTHFSPCVRDQLIYTFDVLETKHQPVLGRVRMSCLFSTTLRRPAGISNGFTIEGKAELKDYQAPDGLYAACPVGQVAVGIRGRAGTYLDAFGLICGPTGLTSARAKPMTVVTMSADKSHATYYDPTIRAANGETVLLDWCREWATNCGKPAAEAYCRHKGFGHVDNYALSTVKGRTGIFTTQQICAGEHCTGFGEISCKKSGMLEAEQSQGGSPFGSEKIDKRGIGVTETGLTVADAVAEPASCRAGFVWRVARPEDLVCVTPAARTRTARENAEAANYVDPDGAYGPNTCIAGYVWRAAFEGDAVCVTPEVRAQVHKENRLAFKRRAGN